MLFALASPCLSQEYPGVSPGQITKEYEPVDELILITLDPIELSTVTKPLCQVDKNLKQKPLQRTGQYIVEKQQLYDLETHVGDRPPIGLVTDTRSLYDVMRYTRDWPLYSTQTETKPLNTLGQNKKPVYNIPPEQTINSLYKTRPVNQVDKYFRQKPLLETSTGAKQTLAVPSKIVSYILLK